MAEKRLQALKLLGSTFVLYLSEVMRLELLRAFRNVYETADRKFSVIYVAETLKNFKKNEALIAGINVLY